MQDVGFRVQGFGVRVQGIIKSFPVRFVCGRITQPSNLDPQASTQPRAPRPAYPPGGVQPCNQKSACLMKLTSGPDEVHFWSRDARNFEPTKPTKSTEWNGDIARPRCLGKLVSPHPEPQVQKTCLYESHLPSTFVSPAHNKVFAPPLCLKRLYNLRDPYMNPL